MPPVEFCSPEANAEGLLPRDGRYLRAVVGRGLIGRDLLTTSFRRAAAQPWHTEAISSQGKFS